MVEKKGDRFLLKGRSFFAKKAILILVRSHILHPAQKQARCLFHK
ncbi:hypothetical protein [Oscillatoria nigro-viridis]|nr:hypothetical protein [Oscillatoria nigro-viridis]